MTEIQIGIEGEGAPAAAAAAAAEALLEIPGLEYREAMKFRRKNRELWWRSRLAKEQETLYNFVGNLTPGIPEHTTTSRILVERQ